MDVWFSRVNEISRADYCPTVADCVRVRNPAPKSGLEETAFTWHDQPFRFLEVCGETRKWMRCLDVCVAVLFMVDLSSYDRSVDQDGGTAINSIRLSLTLFEQMLVAPWFSHADVTLLLNKRDSFEDKIRRGN
jgi:hypothetical protein